MKKTSLPSLQNRISFLYIDYGKIHQLDSGICLYQDNYKINIPCATIACIMLGPGTSITHRAVQNISNSGCLVVWTGENINHMYAYGTNNKMTSNNLLKQIEYHENHDKHLMSIDAAHSRIYS